MSRAIIIAWSGRWRVFQSPFIAGRRGAAIDLSADPFTNQRHALFAPRARMWVVSDLKSRNGTWLASGDGAEARVTTSRRLLHGDVVRVGQTSLTVILPEVSRRDPSLGALLESLPALSRRLEEWYARHPEDRPEDE